MSVKSGEWSGMIVDRIREELFRRQDLKYREMQIRTIPTVKAEAIIGVRTPELRAMAKELSREEEIEVFLNDLPHLYFEENQLHAFILSGMKDYAGCLDRLEKFLPYVDNWATCDQMSPKVFKKHRQELLVYIREWICSGEIYKIRFAVGMLMEHFLEEDFAIEYMEMVAGIRSGEYYVNMMVAWYFATALAKQYDAALPYLEDRKLDTWTHNKTIQKAVESYRISTEQKTYLKTLKIKNKK